MGGVLVPETIMAVTRNADGDCYAKKKSGYVRTDGKVFMASHRDGSIYLQNIVTIWN